MGAKRSIPTLTRWGVSPQADLVFRATDATAAAKLNLSVRTVAYAVQNLMERYGVRSRFQLGLVLGLETNATETPSSRGENT